MKLATIKKIHIYESLENVEKQLKFNLRSLRWEIEYTQDLRTIDNKMVKMYIGVTSVYGGSTFFSVLGQGGGYSPYYIQLKEIDDLQTEINVVVTGSERNCEDTGKRNENIVEQLLQMCRDDCTNKSFKDKAKNFFQV